MKPLERPILCVGFFLSGEGEEFSTVCVTKSEEIRSEAFDLMGIRLKAPDLSAEHFETPESYLDHVWEAMSSLLCHSFNQEEVFRIPFKTFYVEDSEAMKFTTEFIELLKVRESINDFQSLSGESNCQQ